MFYVLLFSTMLQKWDLELATVPLQLIQLGSIDFSALIDLPFRNSYIIYMFNMLCNFECNLNIYLPRQFCIVYQELWFKNVPVSFLIELGNEIECIIIILESISLI